MRPCDVPHGGLQDPKQLPLTCVLSDLPLGDHLLAFRIHDFTVLVLFEALQHILRICFWAESLPGGKEATSQQAKKQNHFLPARPWLLALEYKVMKRGGGARQVIHLMCASRVHLAWDES